MTDMPMTDAPERVTLAKLLGSDNKWDVVGSYSDRVMSMGYTKNTEYVRADLSDRAAGYAQAVEDAYNALFPIPAASMEQEQIVQRCQYAIRALSPTPADPVAEAAKVLAEAPAEDLIAATEAALHDMGVPRPKDSKQHHRAYFLAVCRALAQKEGD